MDLVWDILAAAGVAAAIGMRPFLPVLLVGALAAGNAGVSFKHGDFSFLQSWPFLLAVVLLVLLLDFTARRRGYVLPERGPVLVAFVLLAVGLGAAEGGGFLVGHKHLVILGCAVGALCAALGFFAIRSLLLRTSRRLDAQAAGALPLYAEGAGLLTAAVAVFAPPLVVVVLAALIWLLFGGRRRSGEKYAGLRILR